MLNISSYRGHDASSVTTTAGGGSAVDLRVPVSGHELVERVRQRQRQPDVRRPATPTSRRRCPSCWPDRRASRRCGTTCSCPGRVVIAEETNRALQSSFRQRAGVPRGRHELLLGDADRRRRDHVDYAVTNRSDGIVGVTQGGAPPTRSGRSFGGAGTGRDWDDLRAVRPSIVRHMGWRRSVVQGDRVQATSVTAE